MIPHLISKPFSISIKSCFSFNKTRYLSTGFLEIFNAKSNDARHIAYEKTKGTRNVGVVYIPGFMSAMSGVKATKISEFCIKNGFSFIRYDPTGLGTSHPIALKNANLSYWMQDASEVLKRLADGPQLVIGSSMGAWITLTLALKDPKLFSSILLISPGINFAQRYKDSIFKLLPPSVIKTLEGGGSYTFSHPEYGKFPISLHLVNDMLQYNLDLDEELDVHVPVKIIHGLEDSDVPYMEALNLLKKLKSKDVELTYIKHGQHRLVEEDNLDIVFHNILRLASKHENFDS